MNLETANRRLTNVVTENFRRVCPQYVMISIMLRIGHLAQHIQTVKVVKHLVICHIPVGNCMWKLDSRLQIVSSAIVLQVMARYRETCYWMPR